MTFPWEADHVYKSANDSRCNKAVGSFFSPPFLSSPRYFFFLSPFLSERTYLFSSAQLANDFPSVGVSQSPPLSLKSFLSLSFPLSLSPLHSFSFTI